MTRKWRTPKSENPEFFFTSYLGQGSSLVRRRRLNLKKKNISAYSYLTEICDGMGVNDPEVKQIQKKKKEFERFRPRVNFGGKQKVDLQNFVPEGHPTGPSGINNIICFMVMNSPPSWKNDFSLFFESALVGRLRFRAKILSAFLRLSSTMSSSRELCRLKACSYLFFKDTLSTFPV